MTSNNQTTNAMIVVRMSTSSDDGYVLMFDAYDDGDTVYYPRVTLYRVDAGTLSSSFGEWDYTGYTYCRLDVSGTGSTVTLTVKGSTNKSSWTTLGTTTDTSGSRKTTGTRAGVKFLATGRAFEEVGGGDL